MNAVTTPPAAAQVLERIEVLMAGDKISLELSNDGCTYRLMVQNEAETAIVAIPAYVLPWVGWAGRKLLANRAVRPS